MEALFAFGAALLSLAAGELGRRTLAGDPEAGAGRLVGRAPRLRGGLGRAHLGRCRRLGRARVPRLLPLRRPPHGAAARRRIAPSLWMETHNRSGVHLRRACGRDCDLRSAARSLRRRASRPRRITSRSSRHGSWRSSRTRSAHWPSSLWRSSRSDVAHSGTGSSWQGSALPPLAPLYPAWVLRKRPFLWQLQHFFFTEVLQSLRVGALTNR